MRWALARFGARLAIASSFSIEDCVVIDVAHRIDPRVRVFALDTGRLPEETYQTADRVRDKYRIEIEWQFPDRVESGGSAARQGNAQLHGVAREPARVLRHPQGRAARPGAGGSRRLGDGAAPGAVGDPGGHAGDRERTAGHGGIAKINPIIGWSESEVWAYANAAAGSDQSAAQEGLSVDRVRALHARRAAGRASTRRAVVVGEPGEQGVWPPPGQTRVSQNKQEQAEKQRPDRSENCRVLSSVWARLLG